MSLDCYKPLPADELSDVLAEAMKVMNTPLLPLPLTLDEFEEVNDQELTCIFAETGMDREGGFDRERAVEILWLEQQRFGAVYGNLQYEDVVRVGGRLMEPMNESAKSELVSAMSALNTYATDEDILFTNQYISETVGMVAHAMEHINKAIELINEGKL